MFEAGRAGARFWILRHGRSTFNGEQRFQGCSDGSELTAEGRVEARRAGAALAGIRFEAVYTSPLRRARETAIEVAAARRYETTVIVEPMAAEVELFGWEGRRYAEVCESEPEEYGNWRHAPAQFSLMDGEGRRRYPVVEAFERARRFWAGARALSGDVLVATHNGMGRALILSALGLGAESFHAIEQHNTGLSLIEFPAGGGARLKTMNSTAHLDAALPKIKGEKTGLRLVLSAGAEWAGAEGAARLTAGPEGWERLLERLREPGLRPLKTMVAEGAAGELGALLARLPGVPAELARACRVEEGGLSVLHFAGPNSRGVLQTLNFSARRHGARMEPAA